MIILIRKRMLLCMLLGVSLWLGTALIFDDAVPIFHASEVCERQGTVMILIDPGHGGEDGGALSTDQTVKESNLNLSVAQRVEGVLRLLGQASDMTRREDVSIHTGGDTLRARKVSDIHHRVELVHQMERGVLLSIHQNSLPSSPATHGAQVFWNAWSGAEPLALSVQDALNLAVNQRNEKHAKPAPKGVYLMKKADAPGILVECGFLTNAEETRKLQEPSYQRTLAVSIAAGLRRGLEAKEEP